MEKYDAIGFTENDIRILSLWILEDNNKFGYEALSEIVSWKEKPEFQCSKIKMYFKDFVANKHSRLLFDIWLALLVACMLTNNMCRFFATSNLLLMAGEYSYLYYIGRVIPRVEYGIVLSAIFSLAVCLGNYYVKRDYDILLCRKYIAGILVFSLLFLRNDYVVRYRDYYTGENQKDWEAQGKMVEKLSQNKDCVYILNTLSFIWPCLYFKPYEKPPTYFVSNCILTGTWCTNSPFSKELQNKMGLENPMSDLLYKDNVYYVKSAYDGVDAELLFLQENYKIDAQVRVEENMDGYNIYKFY